jgi:hypothetical protein
VICALRREDFQGISAYPSDKDLEPAQIASSNEAYFLEGRFWSASVLRQLASIIRSR